MRSYLQLIDFAGRPRVVVTCLGGIVFVLITCTGCLPPFPKLPEPCDCVDPNGEDHLCFDFVVDMPIAAPSTIKELEDFTITWNWRYAWQPCHGEGPGKSGPDTFTEIWTLSDETGATIETCTSSSPGCPSFSEFEMGSSHSGFVTFLGLPVPDGKASATYYFTIELQDVPANAECSHAGSSNDDGETGCAELQPNIQTLQFVVMKCPCDQGTKMLDVSSDSLAYDSSTGNNTITWKDCYNVALCGQEEEQLTGSAAISERVTLYKSGVLFDRWESPDLPDVVVELTTCVDRTLDLGHNLPPDDYNVIVEIVSYSAVECHADSTNNAATVAFVIP